MFHIKRSWQAAILYIFLGKGPRPPILLGVWKPSSCPPIRTLNLRLSNNVRGVNQTINQPEILQNLGMPLLLLNLFNLFKLYLKQLFLSFKFKTFNPIARVKSVRKDHQVLNSSFNKELYPSIFRMDSTVQIKITYFSFIILVALLDLRLLSTNTSEGEYR